MGQRLSGWPIKSDPSRQGSGPHFITINSIAPHLIPSWDPVSTVVHADHGSDVDTVVIDGQIVMDHRKMLTLDEAAIISEAIERAPQVALRAGLKLGPRWPVE